MIKGNPYRVVLVDDPITPGWVSHAGGTIGKFLSEFFSIP